MTKLRNWMMAGALGLSLFGARPLAAVEPPQSLYQRLGGAYAIASVVDDFIDRIMVDPALNANPAVNEAHHRVSKAGFKFEVTALVCQATGGPEKYVGRAMGPAHAQMKITQKEWEVFIKDFKATLDKFKVPAREQGELLAIVETTHNDIVVKGTNK